MADQPGVRDDLRCPVCNQYVAFPIDGSYDLWKSRVMTLVGLKEGDPASYAYQHRKAVIARLEKRGYGTGALQYKWRNRQTPLTKYDSAEVEDAICDALNREGVVAWPGDGVSCVEQMVRAQHERAERAEALLARIRDMIPATVSISLPQELCANIHLLLEGKDQ